MNDQPTTVAPPIVPRKYAMDARAVADFDLLVRLAADICEVPGALLALVDDSNVSLTCAVGVDVRKTPPAPVLQKALLNKELTVVCDVAKDPVAEELSRALGVELKFYAVAPLKSPEGRGIGALLIVDTVPRALGPRCEESLRVLGRELEAKLEDRRLVCELRAERDALLRRLGSSLAEKA
jgi:hypothetical protein